MTVTITITDKPDGNIETSLVFEGKRSDIEQSQAAQAGFAALNFLVGESEEVIKSQLFVNGKEVVGDGINE